MLQKIEFVFLKETSVIEECFFNDRDIMKHGIIIGNFKYRYLELTQCSNQRTQVDEFAILYLINSKVLISVPVQLVDC